MNTNLLPNKYFKTNTLFSALIIIFFVLFQSFSYPITKLIKIFPGLTSILYPLAYIIPYIFLIFTLKYLIFKPKDENLTFLYKFSSLKIYFYMFLFFIGTYFVTEILVNNLPDENSEIFKIIDENSSFDTQKWVSNYLKNMKEGLDEVFKYFDKFPISALITVGIIGPILEEILFRGIVLQGLLNSGKSPSFAILFSSFLFSVVHINPWQMLGAFLLGLAIGLVYQRTQSIYNAILLHIFNNLSLGMLYVFYNEDTVSNLFNINQMTIFVIGFVIFFLFGNLFYKSTTVNN